MTLSEEREFSFSKFIHLLFTAFLAMRELHTVRSGSYSLNSDIGSTIQYILHYFNILFCWPHILYCWPDMFYWWSN